MIYEDADSRLVVVSTVAAGKYVDSRTNSLFLGGLLKEEEQCNAIDCNDFRYARNL